MPLANDNILSNSMTTNVEAYVLSLSQHYFVAYNIHNVNGKKHIFGE
jgi:hypothetical protein